MAQILKQSTAVDVLIGPFLDISDGSTAETGESPSVKLSKNGQTLAAKNDATTPVHDADGYYNCELDATDTNTVGTLVLTVAASANALPVRHEFQVVEEDTYEFLYASGATPDTDVAAILTDTGTTLDNLVDDLESRLGIPSDLGSGATISANMVDIEAQTDDIGAAGAGLTAIPWNADWDAEVQSEANDALVALGLDHLVSTSVTGTDIADDSIIAQLVDDAATADWDNYDNTTASLEALNADTDAIVADTNELQGDWVNGGRLDLILDELTSQGDTNETKLDTIAGYIDTEIAAILVDTGTTLDTKINTIDTLVDAIKAVTDNLPDSGALTTLEGKIDTIDTIVDDLKSGIIYGAAATGTLSTTQATSDLTGYADDQLIGRVLVVLTGDAAGEATDITDYANASGLLTFTALTTAMANGDTFKIV